MPFKLFPFIKPHSRVGVDIQPGAAHFVQLFKRRRRFRLKQAVTVPLPSIIQWDSLSLILSEKVEQLGLSGESTILCLPNALVRIASISLPKGLTDEEIEAEILMYLQQQVQGLEEPLAIDFSIVPTNNPDANNLEDAEIRFAVTSQTYLSDYLACMQKIGLNVKIVDITSYAQERALAWDESAGAMDPDFLAACGAAMRELPPW